MATPKELLSAETVNLNIPFNSDKLTKSESSVDGSNEGALTEISSGSVPGKEGWLYREIDTHMRNNIAELYTKVWVSIYDHRLLFSDGSSVNTSGTFSSLFEATHTVKLTCFGYVDLGSQTEVKTRFTGSGGGGGTTPKSSVSSKRKPSFFLRDGDISITFGADNEKERDQWVEIIRQAIRGVSHFLPLAGLVLPASAAVRGPPPPPSATSAPASPSSTAAVSKSARSSLGWLGNSRRSKSGSGDAAEHDSDVDAGEAEDGDASVTAAAAIIRPRTSSSAAPGVGASAVDFPTMSGYLKKTSHGKGKLSMSGTQKRWFRLEAGELRYYYDEDTSASKLKDCIDLRGSELLDSGSAMVHIKFGSGVSMELEASSDKLGAEWRDAFAETIVLLNQQGGGAASTGSGAASSGRSNNIVMKPTRRLNVHDSYAPGEHQHPHHMPSPSSSSSSGAGAGAGGADLQQPTQPRSRAATSFLSWRTSAQGADSSSDDSDNSGDAGDNGSGSDSDSGEGGGDSEGGGGSGTSASPVPSGGGRGGFFWSRSASTSNIPPSSTSGGVSDSSRRGRSNTSVSMKGSASSSSTRETSASALSPTAARRPRNHSTVGIVNRKTGATSDGESFHHYTHTSTAAINKSMATLDMLKACLQQNFLLKRLPDVVPLIDKMKNRTAVPGEIILWQGSSGDEFYVLESGLADVIKDGVVVGHIHPGKSFGELALLNNAVRQASIRASHLCHLWFFTRRQYRHVAVEQEQQLTDDRINFLSNVELFSKLVRSSLEKISDVMQMKHYETGDKIIRQGDAGDAFYMVASGRVVVTQSTTFGPRGGTELVRLGPGKHFGELALIDDAPRKASVTATTHAKCWTLDRQNFLSLFGSMEDALNESMGVQMLRRAKLLEALTDKQLETVSKCLVSKHYVDGETIIKQGDVGDSFYLIADGEVSVQVNHVQVATLEAGSFFGEMSLLSNERRSATVISIQETHCLVLSRGDFNELLGPLEELNEEAQRRKELTLHSKRGGGGGSGGAAGRSRFMTSFMSAFGTGATTASSPSSSAGLRKSTKNSNALFANTNAVLGDIDQFQRIRKLGVGTFGTVFLVSNIDTDKLYALKVLHKEHLKDFCQERYCFTERDIMLILVESQYVAALYATMQDDKSIYLVQQFIPGGDLWSLLYEKTEKETRIMTTKEGGFPLNQATFYIANVVAALNHMHEQEIIYRNLKPENLVIDGSGYLKIIDFGSAKQLPLGMKTNTLCGAPEYIAPEMVLSRGYNKAIDFWAVGILFFELLSRKTPFAHSSLSMIYQNIIDSEDVIKSMFVSSRGSGFLSSPLLSASSKRASISSGSSSSSSSTAPPSSSSPTTAAGSLGALDPNAKSLISNLLLFHPNMRIGMRHNGMEDVWSHPCMNKYSLEAIEQKSVKTVPFIPNSEESALMSVQDADVLDMFEDEDDIPEYTGKFDYYDF